MKLIVFQGNPGLKYRKTRHNVGFVAGDFYAKAKKLRWQKSAKFKAEIAELPELALILVKPLLFYNQTGVVVQNLASFYKISPARDLLVVCDDINLDFGTIRVRQQGSDGGNNGLKSIIQALGSDNFTRIRLGTHNQEPVRANDTKFVLSNFNRVESRQLPDIFAKTADLIDDFADDKLEVKTH
jgi:PTH1 family peptidyl-tRNA hydrolase